MTLSLNRFLTSFSSFENWGGGGAAGKGKTAERLLIGWVTSQNPCHSTYPQGGWDPGT